MGSVGCGFLWRGSLQNCQQVLRVRQSRHCVWYPAARFFKLVGKRGTWQAVLPPAAAVTIICDKHTQAAQAISIHLVSSGGER